MIADLTEAARLLEIDPIRAKYPESIYTEANVDKFYDYRYMHLNYFAVKALLARVCMWEGSDENKHTALLAALEVIDDPASVGIAGGLTLRTFTDSAKAPTTEMCFPSEHIFALGVTDMAKKIASNLNREYSEQDRQYRTLCIKNSVALSMGMVGALSIVRFRTAVKAPMDTAYMFWALTMGILLGAKLYAIALVVAAAIAAIIFLLTFVHFTTPTSYLLVVHYDEEAEYDVDQMMRRSVKNRRLRSKTSAPVLFLSARDTELDKVVGLEICGDDYLAKPFGVRELIARVRARLRRGSSGDFPTVTRAITAGGITLDEDAHTAKFVAQGMDEKAARAKASKQANEDARFVLPNACETKMVVTMNARSLQNFFHLRCCSRAQWEIRQLAEEMFRLVYPVAPHIFAKAGPACVSGPCPEGKMCCGRTAEVRAKYEAIKQEAGV